jgi:transposase InsO family protein
MKVSERFACRVTGQNRTTQRREPTSSTPADPDAALRQWLRAYAKDHPRRGFRPAYHDARGEGWTVNHKKIQRLWREEGLRVPQRRRRKRTGTSTAPDRPKADAPNRVWAVDSPDGGSGSYPGGHHHHVGRRLRRLPRRHGWHAVDGQLLHGRSDPRPVGDDGAIRCRISTVRPWLHSCWRWSGRLLAQWFSVSVALAVFAIGSLAVFVPFVRVFTFAAEADIEKRLQQS